MRFLSVLCFFLSLFSNSLADEPDFTNRASSAPFITGDTFRAEADYLYDETSTNFDPKTVAVGDVVFVKTDMLRMFFKEKHPHITAPYILISHNSDDLIPGEFKDFLDDPKIVVWMGQNVVDCTHPKLIPVPIGIHNQYWPNGALAKIDRALKESRNSVRSISLYMNFVSGTYPTEREQVYEKFRSEGFCTTSRPKEYEKYLGDMACSKFVLSPRGNGVDCHRTWEALYMGSIPIVKSSSLNQVYEDLPVLIVNNWDDVTPELLEERYQQLMTDNPDREKLFFPYWHSLIVGFKNEAKGKEL